MESDSPNMDVTDDMDVMDGAELNNGSGSLMMNITNR